MDWASSVSLRSLVVLVVLGAVGFRACAHPEDDGSVGAGDPALTFGGDFPTRGFEFLGQLRPQDFPGASGRAADCWGYVSGSGREYALIGVEDGFGFVEITDPIRPAIVHFHPGPGSILRDIKTYGSFAYGVSEAFLGLEVFDLSDIDNGVVAHAGSVTSGGTLSTHNIAVDEQSGFLYRLGGGAGSNNGLRVYDLNQDPSAPAHVGTFNSFYVHDAQVVTYTDGPFAGRQIAFCCSGFSGGFGDTRLRIVDVTDKSNMFVVSSVAYAQRRYAHQGWLSEDRRYFYLNDELDEGDTTTFTLTRVIDVSDIENPFEAGAFTGGTKSVDHNLYIRGDMLYEANYRSGLRVFDLSTNPLWPTEIAWIDTFPANDNTGYDGAWSSYPFFPSGNIIISDIQQGLVIARMIIDHVEFSFHRGIPEVADPTGGTNIHVQLLDAGLTAIPEDARLYLEDALGVHEVPPNVRSPLGHTDFYLPPTEACFDTVRWWIEMPTVEGPVFTAPSRAPVEAFELIVATSAEADLVDDFEQDLGWSVSGDATSGDWERGVPSDANSGDPDADFDGSGMCYVTNNGSGTSAVNGGSTVLTSPAIDVSTGGLVKYAYWLGDHQGGIYQTGNTLGLFVDVSTDDGATWSRVRDYRNATASWRTDSIDVLAESEASPTFRVRFIATDESPAGQADTRYVEAGIDAFEAVRLGCTDCPADLAGPVGVLDFFDVLAFLDAFESGASAGDRAPLFGSLDFFDILAYLSEFDEGCP